MNSMHVAKTEAGVLQNHFISGRTREPASQQIALIPWLSHSKVPKDELA